MRLTSLKLNSLRDVLILEVKDLHNAEKQLLDALPKMAEIADSVALKQALMSHYEETKMHLARLENICDTWGESPTGETCEAMKGLITEGEQYIKADGDPSARDAALIIASQKIEHYEIAGYGSSRTLAQRLGDENAASLLEQTLREEEMTDRKLTELAEGQINRDAAVGVS